MNPIPLLRLLAYEGCDRHARDSAHEREIAFRAAAANSRNMAQLRLAMVNDIAAHADANRASGQVIDCRNDGSALGFLITRTDRHDVAATLALDVNARGLTCRYTSLRSSCEQTYAIECDERGTVFCFWHEGVAQRFGSVTTLSAHLLSPLLCTSRH